MKWLNYALIVAVASAGASWTYADSPTNTNANDTANTPALASDSANKTMQHQPLSAEETTNVDTRLANIVNSATTTNGFNDLVGDLAKPDRDRLASEHYADMTALNTKIDQFRNDFKTKYGQDFMITPAAFEGVQVWQGADKDHAVIRVSELRKEETFDQKNTHSTADDTSKQNNDSSNPGNRNAPSPQLESNAAANQNNPNGDMTAGANGRTDIANAADAQMRMSHAKLQFINEGMLGNGWRLNVNDQTTAQDISTSLGKTLDQLCSNKSAWPTDVHQAYRVVATNVLEAVNSATPSSATGVNNNTTVDNR